MSKGSTMVSFIIGVAVGAALAWYITKKKYEKINEEEIASVKEEYGKHLNQIMHPVPEPSHVEPDFEEHRTTPDRRTAKPSPKAKMTEDPDIPQIISPDEFAEDEGYSVVSLRYYAGDGFLAEENSMELVEDIGSVVGYEALEHIGDYEEDTIHVRNDRLRSYYEIISDERSYHDALAQKNQRKERRVKK